MWAECAVEVMGEWAVFTMVVSDGVVVDNLVNCEMIVERPPISVSPGESLRALG
jgi:hypothetical protein